MINVQQTSRTSQTGCDADIPTRVDGLHEALVRGLNQLLRLFIHISNKECFIEVSMETVVVDRDVNCANNKSTDVTRHADSEDKLNSLNSKNEKRTVEDVPLLQ